MRSLTCIVCPIGCALTVEEASDGTLTVTGNRCPRGAVYAQEEIIAPERVVTATIRLGPAGVCRDEDEGAAVGGLSNGDRAQLNRMRRHGMCDPRRLPVKSSLPCPKERISELLADIYATKIEAPVQRGDLVISNWKGSGIDVIAVRALD